MPQSLHVMTRLRFRLVADEHTVSPVDLKGASMSSVRPTRHLYAVWQTRKVCALGTPVLTAARQLGVDLDSVCGGRGICSRCQVNPAFGEFPKHGLTVREEAISQWNAVEERYDRVRGLPKGRRLGCQATVQGDLVIDVPPESQVHKQVVRKRAEVRETFRWTPRPGFST